MTARLRGRWPTVAGIALALAVIAAAQLVAPGDDGSPWRRPVLGVLPGALALAVLSALLVVQLVANGRESLQHERRLVQTAAALREAPAELECLAT
ncbi:MAG: hypothetical protein FJZ92_02455 [Chloroflexi bacterium]|nr:hypothetical protein [Chloroflexota bacterium]